MRRKALLTALFLAVLAPHGRAEDPPGYLTFAVNVHDWTDPTRSSKTVLRLVSIFEKHHVRADFYFTESIVRAYVEKQPETIQRIRESGMGIGYHVRPPHPLVTGFDRKLRSASDEELARTLRAYETCRLDLRTGEAVRGEPGGYQWVGETFGRPPVVISTQAGDPRLRSAAQKVLRELGARMTIAYHEEGTDPKQPFEQRDGLLVRPSDFSITRWCAGEMRKENFWWNMLGSRMGAEFEPAAYLEQRLAAWTGSRPPFVTALIHENNFYNSGPEAFTAVYYQNEDKRRPASPPYDLEARGSWKPRPEGEAERIWTAYEALVAKAAKRLKVVTAEEIVAMAERR